MSKLFKITGLDLATRSTGWCSGDGSATPDCGAFSFPPFDTYEGKKYISTDLGAFMDLWDRYLTGHIERYKPDGIIYEKPLLIPTDKLRTLRKIYPMGAHVELVCHRRGIECHEEDFHAIKKEVTGSRSADKDDMKAVATRVGLRLPTPGADDAADAWGAWLIGLRSYNPEISRKWDSLIWGRRGGLL